MQNTERSFAAPCTFSDDHIERWGEVYLANPQVRARGVWFETFLLAPERTLAECAAPVIEVHACGLLPAQRAVRDHADTQAALVELGERALAALAAEAHCANGVWVEKLRHHAWAHRRPMKRKLREVGP